MTKYTFADFSFKDMEHALAECDRVSSQRHHLRRECLRRAECWGRIANCAGVVIMAFVVFMSVLTLLR